MDILQPHAMSLRIDGGMQRRRRRGRRRGTAHSRRHALGSVYRGIRVDDISTDPFHRCSVCLTITLTPRCALLGSFVCGKTVLVESYHHMV